MSALIEMYVSRFVTDQRISNFAYCDPIPVQRARIAFFFFFFFFVRYSVFIYITEQIPTKLAVFPPHVLWVLQLHERWDQNQTHLHSLIRIFTRRILDSQGFKACLFVYFFIIFYIYIFSCGQRRLWLECADEQTDLRLRCAHMSEGKISHVASRKHAYIILTPLNPTFI